MSNKLLLRYNKYCTKTIADLESLRSLSDEMFQKQHIADQWNLSQLFDHLLSIEKLSLMYMLRKSQATDLKTAGFKTWLYSFLLRQNLRSTKKFRLPAALPQPIANKTAAELLTEFTEIRAKMADFIGKWDDSKKKLLIFKHPRVGMLTLGQTLKFFADHWFHHQPQLKELLQEANKETTHV